MAARLREGLPIAKYRRGALQSRSCNIVWPGPAIVTASNSRIGVQDGASLTIPGNNSCTGDNSVSGMTQDHGGRAGLGSAQNPISNTHSALAPGWKPLHDFKEPDSLFLRFNAHSRIVNIDESHTSGRRREVVSPIFSILVPMKTHSPRNPPGHISNKHHAASRGSWPSP